MIELKDKVVLVTGGTGFLGQPTCQVLKKRGAQVISFSSKQVDLRNSDEVYTLFDAIKPDYIVHLAGFNGGIQFNLSHPAVIFANNTLIALNVLRCAQELNVKKIVSALTSCAYPGNSGEVLKEEEFWNGPPHRTVECHGLAKRNIEAYSRFLNQQHLLSPAKFVCASITNLFGPSDNFTPTGKVVSNLIRKFVDAKINKSNDVVMMGTGIAKRDLLYVDDAAELVVRTLELYEDGSYPINIGSSQEISIKELAETISKIVGFKGEIVWTGGEDGQLRKLLDTTKMDQILDYKPKISLEEGLKRTVKWYTNQKISPAGN